MPENFREDRGNGIRDFILRLLRENNAHIDKKISIDLEVYDNKSTNLKLGELYSMLRMGNITCNIRAENKETMEIVKKATFNAHSIYRNEEIAKAKKNNAFVLERCAGDMIYYMN